MTTLIIIAVISFALGVVVFSIAKIAAFYLRRGD